MADAILGSITIQIPLNYVHNPVKLETWGRTLDGTMIINYTVNDEDTEITKYHFELPGITKSERLTVRAETLKSGSLDYIDHVTIPEVLSNPGTTGTVSLDLLRELGSTSTADIEVTLNGETQSVTISTGVNPSSGEVYVTTGGVMTFGPCASGTNNTIVNYIPNYSVHVLSDSNELLMKNSTGGYIIRYNLVLEEI